SGLTSSAGRPMPDGRQPVPGGWNRFQLVVDDIAGEVARLRAAGLRFRNAIVSGPGGSQNFDRRPFGQPHLALPASPSLRSSKIFQLRTARVARLRNKTG